MKFKKSIILGFLALSSFGYGQRYKQMMYEKEATFHDIVEEAERYFDIHGRDSKAYRKFYRWANSAQFNLDDNGYIISKEEQNRAFRELKSISKNKTSNKRGYEFNEWQELGPKEILPQQNWHGAGILTSVIAHPQNENILLVCTPGGGVWKSTNGGSSWTPKTDDFYTLEFNCLVNHPTNPEIVYAGTNDNGIVRSLDFGETWQITGCKKTDIRAIAINPIRQESMLAIRNGEILVSYDEFTTFEVAKSFYFDGGNADIMYSPDDTSFVYANNGELFISNDGGSMNSWNQIVLESDDNLSYNIAVSAASPKSAYLVINGNRQFYGFYKSFDNGQNFTKIADIEQYFNPVDNGVASNLLVSQTDTNMLYLGDLQIWRSSDCGLSWDQITQNGHITSAITPSYTHVDIRHLKEINNTVYTCTDGGIFKYDNSIQGWLNLSAGLRIKQFHGMSASAEHPYIISGGVQDNGNYFLNSGDELTPNTINSWEGWGGYVDGITAFVCDVDDDVVIFGTGQEGRVYKTSNMGQTYSNVYFPNSYGGNWYTQIIRDPQDPKTIYKGANKIIKSTNLGEYGSFSEIDLGFSSLYHVKLMAIGIAESGAKYIYANKQEGVWSSRDLYVSKDGGNQWQSLGLAGVLAISVSRSNPEHVTVLLGDKILRSHNAGEDWDDITGNLQLLGSKCIEYDGGSKDGIYAGTAKGVWFIDNTMSDWEQYDAGLPNAEVVTLEISPKINKLRVATYGRGLWEVDLLNSDTYSDFTISPNNYLTERIITFTNNSQGLNGATVTWNFGEGAYPGTATGNGPHSIIYNTPGIKTISQTSTIGTSIYKEEKEIVVYSSSNLVLNAGFESGDIEYWEGNLQINETNVYSGDYAAQATNPIKQNILNVRPNTVYTLKAMIKSESLSNPAVLIASNDNGLNAQNTVYIDDSYQLVSLNFTTGANDDEILIAIGCLNGLYFIDDIKLIEHATANILMPSGSVCAFQNTVFTSASTGSITEYLWEFGNDATPATATGFGPHNVIFGSTGIKDITLTVSSEENFSTTTQSVDIVECEVSNLDFETGTLVNWEIIQGTGGDIVTDAYNSNFAMKLHENSKMQYIVNDLQPNTTYKLIGWQKSDYNSMIAVMVQDYGNNSAYTTAYSPEYSDIEIQFTTGSSSTSATIIVQAVQGDHFLDEFSVVALQGPSISIISPIENDSFVEGDEITIQTSATDNDGTIDLIEFYEGNNKLGEINSGNTYTWNNAPSGTYSLSAIATDNDGLQQTSETININITQSVNLLTLYNVPRSDGLPSKSQTQYNYCYVITTNGNGPDLSNVTSTTLNWTNTLHYSNLDQLALNLTTAPYYLDLRQFATYDFLSANPYIILSGTGIAGLDGSYYVNFDGDNFILVEQSGEYALYFSNDPTGPTVQNAYLKSEDISFNISTVDEEISGVEIYPIPVIEILNIKFSNIDDIVKINLYDEHMRLISEIDNIKTNTNIDMKNLSSGVYILNVVKMSSSENMKIIKQ